MYADTCPYMFRTVAASVLVLYVILGFPRLELPDPVSQEKLVTTYSHQRRNVGHLVDSRTLTVDILPHKVTHMVDDLTIWISRPHYTLGRQVHHRPGNTMSDLTTLDVKTALRAGRFSSVGG